jgi:hypothetical protein
MLTAITAYMYLVSKKPFTKEMLQIFATNSLYASEDWEKHHQISQLCRLWLYEEKRKSCDSARDKTLWSS